jgi:hypothetical protein
MKPVASSTAAAFVHWDDLTFRTGHDMHGSTWYQHVIHTLHHPINHTRKSQHHTLSCITTTIIINNTLCSFSSSSTTRPSIPCTTGLVYDPRCVGVDEQRSVVPLLLLLCLCVEWVESSSIQAQCTLRQINGREG